MVESEGNPGVSPDAPGLPAGGGDSSVGPGRARRLDSLTGLRFAAALVVFGYHLEGFFYFRAPYAAMSHGFVQGTTGVSFFFILSGFVLTWSHQRGDRPSAFYRRRSARIGPLQVVTWIIMGVILLTLTTGPPLGPSLASLFLLAPWTPGLALHLTMNNPSWSLGCEAFFYLVFPLLFAGAKHLTRAQRRLVLAGLVLVVVGLAVALDPAPNGTTRFWALYFFPPVRLLEFAIGMLLAAEVADGQGIRVKLGPASMLALGAYVADSWAPTTFQPVAVTLLPFMALIVAAARSDVAATPSWLRSRSLVRLGVWSFAIYMVHWPVLTLVSHQVTGRVGTLGGVVLGLVSLAITVAAAAGLYRWVEHPLERRLRGGGRHGTPRYHPLPITDPAGP
ncbi:MAG: acyltransferase family protein [Acidimicrobiales bacterium]